MYDNKTIIMCVFVSVLNDFHMPYYMLCNNETYITKDMNEERPWGY